MVSKYHKLSIPLHFLVFLFLAFLLSVPQVKGQIHCGNVVFVPNSAVTVDFTFDSFSDYLGGVIVNNVAQLKIQVEDKAIPDAGCKWFLTMEIDNNPGAGTAATDWEELLEYGSGLATPPTIDILEIRVRNNCQTSPIDGVFQTFTNHGDVIDIIADLLPLTAAGSCTSNVNGPGDYLTYYNEYTFNIDLKIKPDFSFVPGIYTLDLRFHLEEQP